MLSLSLYSSTIILLLNSALGDVRKFMNSSRVLLLLDEECGSILNPSLGSFMISSWIIAKMIHDSVIIGLDVQYCL